MNHSIHVNAIGVNTLKDCLDYRRPQHELTSTSTVLPRRRGITMELRPVMSWIPLLWLLIPFLIGLIPTCPAQIVDFSSDYYTVDISETSFLYSFVSDVRYDNEDKPLQCRIDLCPNDTTYDNEKGTFKWPDGLIQTEVYLRCPYSVLEPVYAKRACVFDDSDFILDGFLGRNNTVTAWRQPEIDNCPGPPLDELLARLMDEEPMILASNDSALPWYTSAIRDLFFTLTEYSDYPVFTRNIQDLARFWIRAVLVTDRESTSLPRDAVRDAVSIVNDLFNLDYGRNLLNHLKRWEKDQLLECLALLTEMWTPEEGQTTSELSGQYFSVSTYRVSPVSGLQTSDVFESENDPNVTMVAVNTFPTNLSVSIDPGTSVDVVSVMYLGYISFVFEEFLTKVTMREVIPQPPLAFHNGNETFYLERPPVILESVAIADDYSLLSAITFVSAARDHHFRPGHFRPWQYLPPEVNIKVEINSSLNSFANFMSTPSCGQISSNADFPGPDREFNATTWHLLDEAEGPGRLRRCQYSTVGLFAVFAKATLFDGGVVFPPPVAPSEPGLGSSFSEFLGFPYNKELFIAGEVLRAVSLVCLLVTVVSYIVFKSARHGVPTRILLHLCLSLILFNVVLYVAEFTAYTRWGCRMANILRYYLVLVSLSWNVTEAFNLYLMLVKVFRSHISRLVLKAAILSWGLPLVPIIIILSVNSRLFDGVYTEQCKFRCVLKDVVFYYAYLLPVGLMVSTNIVIFSLVVHVLRNHGPTRPGESRRSFVTELCGALSMMFLLGIPWVFSAFGAINETGPGGSLSMLSGVFQVITVVFLNLQGTFIFLFHCVRNPDMRQQWRATCCRRLLPGSSTSGSGSAASYQYKKAGRRGTSDDSNASNKTQKVLITMSGTNGTTTGSPKQAHKAIADVTKDDTRQIQQTDTDTVKTDKTNTADTDAAQHEKISVDAVNTDTQRAQTDIITSDPNSMELVEMNQEHEI